MDGARQREKASESGDGDTRVRRDSNFSRRVRMILLRQC